MSDVHADNLIQHVSELPAYSPPAHSGTVNRRLVGREFGAGFEMILGRVAPGGEASRHYHVDEAQIVYILKGEADIALGDDAPRRCGPGTVIRIPKGLAHEVVTAGDEPPRMPRPLCAAAGAARLCRGAPELTGNAPY